MFFINKTNSVNFSLQESEIDSSSEKGTRPKITGNVTFEDVHFTYPAREDVKLSNCAVYTDFDTPGLLQYHEQYNHLAKILK